MQHLMPESRPSVDALLRVYESERVENRQGLQVIGALIAAILAYIIPVTGFVASGCNRGRAPIHFFNHGCAPRVPAAVIYMVPFPALALLGFLLSNQAVLETGGTYLKHLEEMVEHAINPDAAYKDSSSLRLPQHHRIIVPIAYGVPPFALAAVFSHLVVGFGALALIVVDIAILPWTTHTTTSQIFCSVDILACGFLAWCYIQIALWHTSWWPWEPSRLGDDNA
jgi:hypothetical protein